MLVWLVAAVLIVLALAAYAGYLFWQIHTQKQHQQAVVEKLVQQKQESEIYARDSIVVLLRGLQQEQVSLTEVAIRITGLCQVFGSEERGKYRLFEELAAKTSHIPIKDDWKALPRKQKNVFDKERLALESQYQSRIQVIVKEVLATTATSAPMVQMFNPETDTLH